MKVRPLLNGRNREGGSRAKGRGNKRRDSHFLSEEKGGEK